MQLENPSEGAGPLAQSPPLAATTASSREHGSDSEKGEVGTGTPLDATRSGQPASKRELRGFKACTSATASRDALADGSSQWFLVVTSMMISTFLYALDNTVVVDVQVDIIRSLGQVQKLPWLGTAFAWATMSTILPWSRVFCLYDAKWIYLTATIIFEVGSALCGAAPNMDVMIVGRVIAGIGAAGMYVGCLTLISVTTTEQERPTYMGYTGLTWGTGFILGPVVGGGFAQSNATWRWAFYLNLLLFVLVAPAIIFLLPPQPPQKNRSILDRAKDFDWAGSLLLIGSSLALIIAVSFGGTVYKWNGGEIIGSFVTAAVGIILLVLQQHFELFTTRKTRVMPLQFFKRKIILCLCMMITAPAIAILCPVYYLPIYFQLVRGDGPVEAAVRLLPIIVPFVVLALVGGAVVSKTGRYYPWFAVGSVLALVGSCLLYADVKSSTSVQKIYGYSALIGIGCGAVGQISYSIAQFKVDPDEVMSAIGFICTGQYFGIVFSLIISGAVFQNLAQQKIAALLPPGTPLSEIRAAVQGIGDVLDAQSQQTRAKVLNALLDSIHSVYPVSMTGAVLMVVTVLFLKNEKIIFR